MCPEIERKKSEREGKAGLVAKVFGQWQCTMTLVAMTSVTMTVLLKMIYSGQKVASI